MHKHSGRGVLAWRLRFPVVIMSRLIEQYRSNRRLLLAAHYSRSACGLVIGQGAVQSFDWKHQGQQKNSRILSTVIGGTAPVFLMAIDEANLLIINLHLGTMLNYSAWLYANLGLNTAEKLVEHQEELGFNKEDNKNHYRQ